MTRIVSEPSPPAIYNVDLGVPKMGLIVSEPSPPAIYNEKVHGGGL